MSQPPAMDLYVFIIAMTAIVGGIGFLLTVALSILALVFRRKKAHTLTADEERMLRELWSGLQRMEERVRNLESILIARHGERDR